MKCLCTFFMILEIIISLVSFETSECLIFSHDCVIRTTSAKFLLCANFHLRKFSFFSFFLNFLSLLCYIFKNNFFCFFIKNIYII